MVNGTAETYVDQHHISCDRQVAWMALHGIYNSMDNQETMTKQAQETITNSRSIPTNSAQFPHKDHCVHNICANNLHSIAFNSPNLDENKWKQVYLALRMTYP